MSQIIITNFTDPVCVWCYATEPVFRALEMIYDDEIEIRLACGGLVPDIDDLFEEKPGIDAVNAKLEKAWQRSYERHHMPIAQRSSPLFTEKYRSSFPQNIYSKAVGMVAPHLMNAYMRQLRVEAFAFGRNSADPDLMQQVARDLGVPVEAMMEKIESGEAEKYFKGELNLGTYSGVEVFPTSFIKNDRGQQFSLKGFVTVEDYIRVILELTDGKLVGNVRKPDDDLLIYLLNKYRNLFAEEVRQAFGFASESDVRNYLERLANEGVISIVPCAQSFYITKRV